MNSDTYNQLMGTVLPFLLITFILFIANLAQIEREKEAKGNPVLWILLGATLILFYLGLLLSGVASWGLGSILQNEAFLEQYRKLLVEQGQVVDPDQIFALFESVNIGLIAGGLGLSGLLGLLCFLPAFRRLLGRFLPIDPHNLVHTVALALVPLTILQLMLTLGIGLENMAELLAEGSEVGVSENVVLLAWVQAVMFMLLSLIGVGWLTRRSAEQLSVRLKMEQVSWRTLLIGLLSGLGLLAVLALIGLIIEQLGWVDPNVEELSELLYGSFFSSPWGILTVGITAGISEEMLFRGALQPRFGRLFTAVVFALLHANYGLSSTALIIFFAGYGLGYIRDRYDTPTAMVAHASFNSMQALLAYLASTYFSS